MHYRGELSINPAALDQHSPPTNCRAGHTLSEERVLQKRADAKGQNLREWARDVLLRVALFESRAEVKMHISTELVKI